MLQQQLTFLSLIQVRGEKAYRHITGSEYQSGAGTYRFCNGVYKLRAEQPGKVRSRHLKMLKEDSLKLPASLVANPAKLVRPAAGLTTCQDCAPSGAWSSPHHRERLPGKAWLGKESWAKTTETGKGRGKDAQLWLIHQHESGTCN